MSKMSKSPSKDSWPDHRYVVRVSGGWAVKSPGLHIGRRIYQTKAAALRAVERIVSKRARGSARSNKPESFTVGRSAFGKISAIEGLYLSSAMKQDFKEFDQRGLTNEKRRRSIIAKYASKIS
jgi:hypothetical protein